MPDANKGNVGRGKGLVNGAEARLGAGGGAARSGERRGPDLNRDTGGPPSRVAGTGPLRALRQAPVRTVRSALDQLTSWSSVVSRAFLWCSAGLNSTTPETLTKSV